MDTIKNDWYIILNNKDKNNNDIILNNNNKYMVYEFILKVIY